MFSRKKTPTPSGSKQREQPPLPEAETVQDNALRIATRHMSIKDREQVKSAMKLASSIRNLNDEKKAVSKMPVAIYLKMLQTAKEEWLTKLNKLSKDKQPDFFKKELNKLIKAKELDMELVAKLIEAYRIVRKIDTINIAQDLMDEISDIYDYIFIECKIGNKIGNKNISDIIILMNAITGGDYTGAHTSYFIYILGTFPTNMLMDVANILIKRTTRQARNYACMILEDNYSEELDELEDTPYVNLVTRHADVYEHITKQP